MADGTISRDQLAALVQAGEIDTIVTASTDMQGRQIGKRVRADFFVESVADHGTHFCTYLLGTDMDLNTPDGYEGMNWETGYGDYLAAPDWSTLRVIPWLEKTALVVCDVVDEASHTFVEVAPRTILRRQVERAAAMGFVPKIASEFEFYVFKETFDSAKAKNYHDLQRFGWYSEDYQLFQSTKAEPLYRKYRNLMTQAGIPIEFSKGEAAPGQHEVNIRYGDAIESADRAVLFKHGAKEIAYQDGLAITFMSKPHHTWTGSSGHIHVSLWHPEFGSSLFPNTPGSAEMSQVMRWFLGGMMAAAREFSLFIASSVNAYKRFATASWAPVNILWSHDNRTCGFRVVGNGSSLRIENRLPGGDSNAYLAFAAVLAAGLSGIERKIEPPAEFHGNAYKATGVPRVPRALYEAIETWEESELAREVFGARVHQHYLNAARVEQQAYDQVVTDWERERYFERG